MSNTVIIVQIDEHKTGTKTLAPRSALIASAPRHVLEQILGIERNDIKLESLVHVFQYDLAAIDLHGQEDILIERNRSVAYDRSSRLGSIVDAHVLIERLVKVQLFDVLAARSLLALVQQLDECTMLLAFVAYQDTIFFY